MDRIYLGRITKGFFILNKEQENLNGFKNQFTMAIQKKLIVLVLGLAFFGCSQTHMVHKGNTALIPLPNELHEGTGYFEVNPNTTISIENDEHAKIAGFFARKFQEKSGWQPQIIKGGNGQISFVSDPGLEPEAYHLAIDSKAVTIKASSGAGFFYAIQTINQLLPVEFFADGVQENAVWQLPSVTIADKPAFGWRGYMLDVSRHFYGVEDIKKVLDFMAELKLNRFHWHLTDDQGWRIEIKKYPKLTEVGAWRVDYNTTDENLIQWWGRPKQKKGEKATYGGYYTQEDIKEIVAYAKERYIEILPEIDVPGHSQAILASYPEFSCEPDRTFYVATGGVIKDNALCASNPATYTFMKDVLDEVSSLFPLNYIHIGGDECNKEGWHNHQLCQDFIKKHGLKDEKELQSHFIKEIEKMVNGLGKNMIGWNEILEGGLAPNATVMSWQGEHGGIVAAKAGHDVIMTPMERVYLDLRQGQADYEPNMGYSEALLSACYDHKVIPEGFSEEQASKILGLQGNLWNESISTWGRLTYMTFPRLFAVAENGWTTEDNQGFDHFIHRLKPQLAKLDATGVRYAKSVFNPWIRPKGNGESIEITLASELDNPEIRYTLDGSEPTAQSTLYQKPFNLTATKILKAAIFDKDQRLGNVIEDSFPVHKAAGAKVINLKAPKSKASTKREVALTDLNYGELEAPGDQDWVHFHNDLDVEIQLDNPTDIMAVTLSSFKLTIFGNYPPMEIEVYGATKNGDYQKIGESGNLSENTLQGRNKIRTKVKCPAQNISRLRIKAKALDPIPEWHNRPKGKASLMLDEILVF
jgi:hexosaminidase